MSAELDPVPDPNRVRLLTSHIAARHRTADMCRDTYPMSGHLFAFRNRRGDRMKVLFFASGGLCLFYKRLERGTFRWPAAEGERLEIDAGDLGLILEGLDLSSARRQPRWRPQAIAMR